uniref:Uncharacterized protein n=1 Tax=Molossus molossus TaxID=27622 RepID=A0A7J8ES41_MOLMO|nr:hypothetical protein HJG59_008782 [Molossus molossus]
MRSRQGDPGPPALVQRSLRGGLGCREAPGWARRKESLPGDAGGTFPVAAESTAPAPHLHGPWGGLRGGLSTCSKKEIKPERRLLAPPPLLEPSLCAHLGKGLSRSTGQRPRLPASPPPTWELPAGSPQGGQTPSLPA